MEQYHWKLDAAGEPTDIPDDKLDDECDALRYMVMNVFGPKGMVLATSTESDRPDSTPQKYSMDGWMQQVISEHTGGQNVAPVEAVVPAAAGRKGSFLWDL